MDLNVYRFGGSVPYRNIEYLGRCYDFIKFNPLDLSEQLRDGGGCMPTFAIDITPETCDVLTPDQRILIPRGATHRADAHGVRSSRAQMWSSMQDFTNTFKNTVSGGLAIEGMFTFSASAEFSKISKELNSSKSVMTFVQSFFSDCSIQLKEDPGLETDASKRSPGLSPEFIQGVRDLVSEDRCQEFIARFGTHYAHEVTFGGRMYQRAMFSEEASERYRKRSVDIALSAEFTYSEMTGRAKASTSSSGVERLFSSEDLTVDDLRWVGGTPNTDVNKWVASIRDDPKPMRLSLTPLHRLMTKERFKDIRDIQDRREWMEVATERYILDQSQFKTAIEELVGKAF